MKQTLGVIDLGSNSCRLTISELRDRRPPKQIGDYRDLVRLSQGLAADGKLHTEAIARTLSSLTRFRALCKDCDDVIPIATAAVRMAKNKDEFLNLVKQATGFSIEVISGDREAYYDYMGVIHTLPVTDGMIIDVGGGSTELILVRERKLCGAVSLPFGAVVLYERFGNDGEAEMVDFVRTQLAETPIFAESKGLPLIGMGGSARALMVMAEDTKKPIHGRTMPPVAVRSLVDTMCKTPPEERAQIPRMDKARADIMVSGCTPLLLAMEQMDASKLICCQSGLREGVIYDYLERKKEE